jgi:hypothetical protein
LRTILINLPLKCRGYIYEDVETGEKVCVLNARLTHESNIETYKHECQHLNNNDFESKESINTIEARAHTLDK